jgi:hypothetical protein
VDIVSESYHDHKKRENNDQFIGNHVGGKVFHTVVFDIYQKENKEEKTANVPFVLLQGK